MTPRQRLFALLVSVLFVAASVWPSLQTPPRDSFPLSNYPMFSRARPSIAEIQHVVAVDADGNSSVIAPKWVAGGEVLQARVAVRNTVRRGRRATLQLCRTVAKAIAGEPEFATTQRVEVRTDRYAVLAYFEGNKKPVSSRVHARCKAGAKP